MLIDGDHIADKIKALKRMPMEPLAKRIKAESTGKGFVRVRKQVALRELQKASSSPRTLPDLWEIHCISHQQLV